MICRKGHRKLYKLALRSRYGNACAVKSRPMAIAPENSAIIGFTSECACGFRLRLDVKILQKALKPRCMWVTGKAQLVVSMLRSGRRGRCDAMRSRQPIGTISELMTRLDHDPPSELRA